MKIPATGIARSDVFARMEEYRAADMPSTGRTFGYVFDAGEAVAEVAEKAYTMFLAKNALDPTVYPSLLRFENEVVAMAADHLHGDSDVVGSFTSGGTESIILAVKAARNWARAARPQITTPKMLLPVTAHAAFHKASHYLGVEIVPVPVDPVTFKADVGAMAAAITEDTILLVGSAPSYAHGVVDPIGEIAALAREHDLLCHVDACIGGWLLPYFERLGETVTPFDFRVAGVTSISMDLHKYAYAAKGASVVLYRDKQLRRHQFFACANWTGYTLVNTTIQSSKSGGPLAAAWAVMCFLGDDGYLEIAHRLRDASKRLYEGIAAIDGLRVLVRPEMSLIAVTSDEFSVFEVIDQMAAAGWYIQPQLGFAPHRENFHLSINPSNVEWVEPFLEDLAASVATAKEIPRSDLGSQVGVMFANLSADDLTEEMFGNMLAMAGIEGVGLPKKMAQINEILDALPRPVRERMLAEFVNELFCAREGDVAVATEAGEGPVAHGSAGAA